MQYSKPKPRSTLLRLDTVEKEIVNPFHKDTLESVYLLLVERQLWKDSPWSSVIYIVIKT